MPTLVSADDVTCSSCCCAPLGNFAPPYRGRVGATRCVQECDSPVTLFPMKRQDQLHFRLASSIQWLPHCLPHRRKHCPKLKPLAVFNLRRPRTVISRRPRRLVIVGILSPVRQISKLHSHDGIPSMVASDRIPAGSHVSFNIRITPTSEHMLSPALAWVTCR